MNKKLFLEKLVHYALHEPKEFLQIDGFYLPEGGDDYMHPDKEGDDFHANKTVELMYGSCVRVLIPYETNAKVAARQLKKMAKWLKRQPELIEFAKPKPEETFDLNDIPF